MMKLRQWKRTAAIGLSTVLAVTSLSGCRFGFASDPDDENDTVKEEPIDTSVDTFAYDESLQGTKITLLNSKAEIQVALEKMSKIFEEKAGVQIEVMPVTEGDSPYTKVVSMYNSGNAPTMAILDTTDVKALADEKALVLDGEDWVKEAGNYATEIQGHIFSMPLCVEGKGIIYITHRMEEIFKIADRLTVMRDGQYIGTVRAAETSKDEIIKMMVGRDMSEQYPKDPTEKGEVALEVKGLSYTPPEGSFRRSLKNISLYVRHGEVLGIAGLAGAGRSEFFECLAGVHHGETEGHIYIEGKEVSIKTPADAIKEGISFATEDRKGTGLVLSRSIGENMSLPLLKKFSPMFFMKTSEEKNIWKKQMDTLRVKAPSAKTLASSLSGGNQQKVVLAKWLMTEPKILLLDEPTRGIDVGAKAEIYQLINNLAKHGMAIIVVSSELPEVIGISDRIVTFCEGELTGEFLQQDATQEKLLESATK